jgi:hypothetical protein
MASLLKLASALTLAAGAIALAPSCAENHESVFIRQMQQLKQPDCTVKNDANAIATTGGVLDVGLSYVYVGYPLVGSQLISRGDPKTSRAEANRVAIKGAEVRLTYLAPGGDQELGFFSVQASGIIDTTSSADPAYGVTNVELVPAVHGRKAAAILKGLIGNDLSKMSTTISLNASFKVFGETLGGQQVETANIDFPITACYGCLVKFPADAASTILGTKGVFNCLGAPKEGASTGDGCTLGQDFASDCRACQGLPACVACSTAVACPAGSACVGGSDTAYGRCL